MRQIIKEEELVSVIEAAIKVLGDTVGSTLGPGGNNIIINNGEEVPFITNDGATIARNLEVEDIRVNTILEILKESSLKTEELVGDGTTTTIVLLESLLLEGLEEIKKGKDIMGLKKEFEEALPLVIKEIENEKRVPNKKDYKMIATTSANDKEIGDVLSKVFYKMKEKYAIKLEDSLGYDTYYRIQNGYNLEIDHISSSYFLKENVIEQEDAYILIIKGYIDSLDKFSGIIQDSYQYNKSIIIFAEDYDSHLEQELLAYYLTEGLKVILLKLPDYASHREKIELDISNLSEAVIKNINYEDISINDLGKVEKITLNKKEIILYSDNNKVKQLIKELKEELKNEKSLYEREFIGNRLSKLETGVATIYIGGITKTEIKEKRMRYVDALWALDEAKKGIVIGEGIAYLKISNMLDNNTTALKIIKKALQMPFLKILDNKGIDGKKILKMIDKSKYQMVYDLNSLEIKKELLVIDPLSVVVAALKNAISITMMLLSTNYLVVREISMTKDDAL